MTFTSNRTPRESIAAASTSSMMNIDENRGPGVELAG